MKNLEVRVEVNVKDTSKKNISKNWVVKWYKTGIGLSSMVQFFSLSGEKKKRVGGLLEKMP